MNSEKESFWRTHITRVDGPMIHFGSVKMLDIQAIEVIANEIGSAHFVVDASRVDSELALMGAFAKSMNFPSYFGRNWNALLDLTRDLSWTNAQGFVLVITGADHLMSLANGIFATLIEVVEATIRDWRDERGEYGERAAPVPFHLIFPGAASLKESLLNHLTEPLCEHVEETFISVLPAGLKRITPE